jgi:hypothetical protein
MRMRSMKLAFGRFLAGAVYDGYHSLAFCGQLASDFTLKGEG